MLRITPNVLKKINAPDMNFTAVLETGVQVRSSAESFFGNTTVNDVHYNYSSGVIENVANIVISPISFENKVSVGIAGDDPKAILEDLKLITSHSDNNVSYDQDVNIEYIGKTIQLSFPAKIETISNKVFINYVSGSLGAHIKDQVNSLTGFDKNIYGSVNTRNTPIFTESIDLTGIAYWNSRSNNVHRGGTLISPRHIVMVKHYPLVSGDVVRYITNENEVVERIIVATLHEPSGYDLTIGKLNADVPNTVKFFKVLPTNFASYLSIYDDAKLPIFSCNKLRKIFKRYQFNTYNGSRDYSVHKLADDTTESIISGDSGQPNFYLINGEMVLLGCHSSSEAFFNLASSFYTSQINSMMNTLGGGYNLTTINLSGFNNYE